MNRLSCIGFFSILMACGLQNTGAQDLHIPAPSPGQTIHQNFAMSFIDISYSRPSVKGRTIFGDVVPYGQVWRTGANASTKIEIGEDVGLEGHKVDKGKYALYTIPGKDTWTIILSRDTTLDGAFGYKSDNDLFRFNVTPKHIAWPVETFTINVSDIRPDSAYIELSWEQTDVKFLVTADINSKIDNEITSAMQGDHKPYFAAATFYFNNHKNLHQALQWVNAAIDQNKDAYYMYYLKAEIQAALGQNTDAITTAHQSSDLASKAGNPDYVRLNSKLIASLNGRTQ
jgi:hypothetical protein